jgi:hypothetical protein
MSLFKVCPHYLYSSRIYENYCDNCRPVHTYVGVVVKLINLLTCGGVVVVIIGRASTRNEPRVSVS